MTRETIHQVHVADGFADDCDELINQCSKMNRINYQKFCHVWKTLNFSRIYDCRTSSSEIAELTDEVLLIAKRYMVGNTSNIEESIAGLFLVYALLKLQPFPGFSPLRLVPDDTPAVKRIEAIARREKRCDVLYILGEVLIRGPCHMHVAERERGMESSLRKYLDGYTGIGRFGVRPKGVFYRQNKELDLTRDIMHLSSVYAEAKSHFRDEKGDLDRNLKYSDVNFGKEINMSLKKIINGQYSEPEQSEQVANDRSSSVHALKEKAMKNAVDPIKHLTGVTEKRKNTSPIKKSDIISKPGKVKTGSPTKSVATTTKSKGKKSPDKSTKSLNKSTKSPNKSKKSPNKSTKSPNKSTKSPKAKPGYKRLLYLTADSDDEETVKLQEEDDDYDHIEPEVKKQKVEQNVEELLPKLNDDDTDSQTDEETELHIDTEEAQTKEDFNRQDHAEVEISSVPMIITNENENYIEIEIIDQYRGDNGDETGDLQSKIMSLPDISIERVESSSTYLAEPSTSKRDKVDMATISPVKIDDHIFKKPRDKKETAPKLKRPSRRELKKTGLASKFKRMGVLELANFKEK